MSDWLHDWWAKIAFTLLAVVGGVKVANRWKDKLEARLQAVENKEFQRHLASAALRESHDKLESAVMELNRSVNTLTQTVTHFAAKVQLLLEGKIRFSGDADHAAS
jgi:hypothetical protein